MSMSQLTTPIYKKTFTGLVSQEGVNAQMYKLIIPKIPGKRFLLETLTISCNLNIGANSLNSSPKVAIGQLKDEEGLLNFANFLPKMIFPFRFTQADMLNFGVKTYPINYVWEKDKNIYINLVDTQYDSSSWKDMFSYHITYLEMPEEV